MASTYLSRTPGTPTLNTKFTFSAWIKRSKLGAFDIGFFSKWDTTNDRGHFKFSDSPADTIEFFERVSGSTTVHLKTDRVFRDTSAWYHVVYEADSTQATASDRLKLYINGVQETSFGTETYPSQNYNWQIQALTDNFHVGNIDTGSFFDGSMAHVHFIDGTAYDADTFGETDSTTGIWKPKTAPSVTYGTNGFFLKFENSGSMGTDSSGNANNFTVNGTMTQTIDTPSNVFATANPNDVMKQSSGILKPDFSNGNLTITKAGSPQNVQTFGTIAVTSGKWYWETKASTLTGNGGHRVGVFFGDNKVHSGGYYYGANAFYIHQNGIIYYNSSIYTYMSSISQGDIVNVALDRTNGEIYLGKNGQWSDGAGNNDQTFANAVGIASTLSVSMPNDTTYPFFDVYDDTSSSTVMDINFGNGYFGTTQISSAQNPDDGIGIFEHSVPNGYKALCTKSINAQEYD